MNKCLCGNILESYGYLRGEDSTYNAVADCKDLIGISNKSIRFQDNL